MLAQHRAGHGLPSFGAPISSRPRLRPAQQRAVELSLAFSALIFKDTTDQILRSGQMLHPLSLRQAALCSDTSKYRFLRTTDSNNLTFRGVGHQQILLFSNGVKKPHYFLILPNIQALIRVTAHEFGLVVPNDQQRSSEQV